MKEEKMPLFLNGHFISISIDNINSNLKLNNRDNIPLNFYPRKPVSRAGWDAKKQRIDF